MKMKIAAAALLVTMLFQGCVVKQEAPSGLTGEGTSKTAGQSIPEVEIHPPEYDKEASTGEEETGDIAHIDGGQLDPWRVPFVAPEYGINDPRVLYMCITLNKFDEGVWFERGDDWDNERERYIREKYEIEYDLYTRGRCFKRDVQGVVEPTALYAYWEVITDNYGCIAFSGNYDPIPRDLREVKLPCPAIGYEKVIVDIKERFDVDVEVKDVDSIDLDGDGTEEYIVYLMDDAARSIYKVLLTGDGMIISYLFACTNDPSEFIGNSLTGDTEFFDIDGDGIMEIIVRMVAYEGAWFNVYKYDHGAFDGEFLNECSSMP